MTADFLVNLFTPEGFAGLVKFLVTLLALVYSIFAFLVIRQVNLMNKSFTTESAWVFALLSFVHFFAAVGLVILALIIL